ncbi:hypothetical protein ACFWDI_10685 [Streptomyces sp. NPDC060064]
MLHDACWESFRRIMGTVDPTLVDAAEHLLGDVVTVRAVSELRLRWISA